MSLYTQLFSQKASNLTLSRAPLSLLEEQPAKSAPSGPRPVSKSELDNLERTLDALFKESGIDIDFTRHFFERLNDDRNRPRIKLSEIEAIFKEVAGRRKLVGRIKGAGADWEAILKDVTSKINIPFVLKYDRDAKVVELTNKTVMRKGDFKSPDPVLTVVAPKGESLETWLHSLLG